MRALITGGGTGGHINPAIAIANTIKEKEPDSIIDFCGTSRGMENKLVPAAGYPLHHVEIQGLKRSLSLSNLKTLYLTLTSVGKAKKLLKSLKPDIVIGTGGYVCWPVCKAASKMGIPVVLHESNALPGVAVKMLSGAVDRIYVNFERTIDLLPAGCKEKILRVGNPLKGEYHTISRQSAKEQLGVRPDQRMILSCGGSLGAKRINEEILALMKDYGSKHPDIIHVHATGSAGYQEFMEAFKAQGLDAYPNLIPMEYLYDMPLRLAAADLVINRAGAMTLSELAMLGKAAILIPSPNVTDNHQYKNAKAVSDKDAAILIQESELGGGALTKAVCDLMEDDAARARLGRNFRDFAVENANEMIYNDIKRLVISRKV